MSTETNWNEAPMSQLVDYIITKHHVYSYAELDLISELLTWHVRNYWLKFPILLQAHTLFHQVKAAFEQHMIQEETAGFPMIKAAEKDSTKSLAPFVKTITHHEEAHEHAISTLRKVKETLWNGEPPAEIGPEVATTITLISNLIADLAEHIRLENDILFPRARALQA